MIEPDFPAKLVFPRAWQFVSAAACVALFAAFVVGVAFDVGQLV
jgi:hypothetical protein